MTATQALLLAGGAVGLGLWACLVALTPRQVSLRSALAFLEAAPGPVEPAEAVGGFERIGHWGLQHLPSSLLQLPEADLCLLNLTRSQLIARQLVGATLGLIAPALAGAVSASLTGLASPAWPVIASMIAAILGWWLPLAHVKRQAAEQRRCWTMALACYTDLVALERASGSGSSQALETVAHLMPTPIFWRIARQLDLARWSGQPSWSGLHQLADQIDLVDLADLADIIRLADTEGAAVAKGLAAKSRSLREAQQAADQAAGNARNEQLSLPVSILGIVFLAILITPALLTMLGWS
ncbi:MAG: hypothetical protein LBV30_09825 [Propionibacteriaceae bacterium]|jgi:hypothetical protein|nr:hypothetical protein [Propionibacteriaceae bacterium]